jgi:hypothetical protein
MSIGFSSGARGSSNGPFCTKLCCFAEAAYLPAQYAVTAGASASATTRQPGLAHVDPGSGAQSRQLSQTTVAA